MTKENAIYWFGRRVLIELATQKAANKIGHIYHGFVEDSEGTEAPHVHLFGAKGDILIRLSWEDIGYNPYTARYGGEFNVVL